MRKGNKIYSLIAVMFLCIGGLSAQNVSDELPTKSKRALRIEARRANKDQKVKANNARLLDLIDSKDLVIMDDGARKGLYPESGLVNFFKLKGDTITFQRVRAGAIGTGLQPDRFFYKTQGIVTNVTVVKNDTGRSSRVVISYFNRLTFEPLRAIINVFENRVEVRNDDGTGIEIRGKLNTNSQANVMEVGQNSLNALLRRNPNISPISSGY